MIIFEYNLKILKEDNSIIIFFLEGKPYILDKNPYILLFLKLLSIISN